MEEKSITVADLIKRFPLEVLAGEDYLERKITKQRAHRPGLEFIGYFDFFPMERVQIFGMKEVNYLHQLDEIERRKRIGNIVKYHPPCFIVTRDQDGLQYLKKYCSEEGIPLLRTTETTSEFIHILDLFMTKELAAETVIHGVCLNMYGMGILIRGKSGVGKSETAHTLLGRGHRLVADDIVVLKRLSPQTLLGTHNGVNREMLALRSVGLVNVVRVLGNQAFKDDTRIALDIKLTKWESKELHNELEVESKYTEYLGVKVPHIEIQVQPGRDVAGLIEAAANNLNLKQQGYNAAEEFMERLEEDQTHNES